jgi:hypothetical protein
MSKALQTIREALFATGLVQPVEASAFGKRLSVLCRLLPGQEKPWMKVVHGLLTAWGETEKGTELVLARRYVLRQDQMAFGWYLQVEGKSAKHLGELVEKLLPVLADAKPSLVAKQQEVDEEEEPQEPPRHRPHPAKVGTKAPPRPRSAEEDAAPVVPRGFTPQIRVIRDEVDAKGKRIVIQEMPLPHVYQELNKPNAKGKGATTIG